MRGKTVAIIQARMGSGRLPGKVLMSIGEITVLEHCIKRVKTASRLDDLAVATSESPADGQIVELCERLKVSCVRGSEKNVLSRYAKASAVLQAEIIVRITADCPLVSPEVIDDVIRLRAGTDADYTSNTLKRTFPVGLDVECFTSKSLTVAALEAESYVEKEHVTPYIYNQPTRFKLKSHEFTSDQSWLRLTLDTDDDYTFLKALFAASPLAFETLTSWKNIVETVREVPGLRYKNNSRIHNIPTEGFGVRIL